MGINPLSANATKLSNPLKIFFGKLTTRSVFDHFVALALEAIVKSFDQENREKKIIRDCNLSGIKLYISVAIL